MSNLFTVRRAVSLALLSGGAALAQTPVASAQDQDAAASAPLEQVVVTGSRIRRQETDTPSPLQVITREDIEKTGQQNIGDILREVSADNQGSIPTAFSAGFAAGAAAVSLRGLGVNSTLVLVNGRRMSTYPLADDGSRTFVDLNTLPLAAVERVDVVKDGASAIYGSDAIAGVVNIMLRDHFQGLQVGGNYGTSYEDDGDNTRLNVLAGIGDLGTDRYNAFVAVEASRQQAINQKNRPGFLGTNNLLDYGWYDNRRGAAPGGGPLVVTGEFADLSGPAFTGSTPYGSIRQPGGTQSQRINLTSCPEISGVTNECVFDPINYFQIQPRVDRANIYSKGQFRFTDDMTGYVELGYFYDKVYAVGTPGGISDTGVYNPADPLNPLSAPHTPRLPYGHPDNPIADPGTGGLPPSLSLLTTMFGGRDAVIDNKVVRAIAGLKGSFATNWTYDVGVGYVESKMTRDQTGFVYFPALQAALNNYSFRINPALNSPATMAAISPTLTDKPKSSLAMADATITGELLDLPGGKLGVAVGAEYRKEKYDTPPVPYTDTSDIVGLGYSAFSDNRNIYAGYVELDAPVLSMLDITAAYRYDHYSDVGKSTTPKVGFTFTPIKQIMLRGSYAEGFRAPGPTEAGNSSALGFTNIAIISIGSPLVKPETSKSYSFGVVLSPITGSSLAIDYWRIDRKGEITAADQATIVAGNPTQITATGSPQQFAGASPGSFLYYDVDGALATISGPFTNANKTVTDGIDFDLRQTWTLGDNGGKLEAAILETHQLKYVKTLADGTTFSYAGTQGPFALSSAGGTPRDKGTFELTWSKSALSLTGRMNYVSGMKMVDHNGSQLVDNGDGTFSTDTFEGAYFNVNPNGVVCGVYNPNGSVPEGDCKLPSFITFDFYGKLDLNDHLQLNLSVDNVLNKYTPFDPYTYGGLDYNPTFYQSGAVGRFITLGAMYKF